MGEMDNLRQISGLHRRTVLDAPRTVLIPQKALKKCSFSGAVVTQDGNALAALHIQAYIREQHPLPVCLTQVPGFEHHVTGEILLSKRCLHLLLGLGLFCLFDSLHPVLDGHGTAVESPVVDAPAFHPLHGVAQLLQFRLFLFVLFHLQVEPGLLLIHVEGIVAGVEFRVAIHDLNDPLGNPVDEVPVMGNCQHSALESFDIALQPFYAV